MAANQAPVPDAVGFRLRGAQITRLETFVDAAFAFALTMLAISFDVPDGIGQLYEALKRVPTFVLCFVLLMMFWLAHNRWSRRFGLEDTRSTLLSLALVLVVMIYMFPLRMVISGAVSMLSGGFVDDELAIGAAGDGVSPAVHLQAAFIIYSMGFGLLALILVLLNANALKHAQALQLSALECANTVTEIGVHAIMAACAALSVALSVVFLLARGDGGLHWWHSLPMWSYSLLSIAIPVYALRRERARRNSIA